MTANAQSPIRLLLADDHRIVREGLRSSLARYEFLEIVGEASDGDDAVRKSQELKPDVVIMDIAMPRTNGLQAAQKLRGEKSATKVLVLTVHKNNEYIIAMLECGARGYVLKESSTEELVRAIEAVAAGKTFFSAEVSGLVLERMLQKERGKAQLVALSEREREVLELIAKGYSSKQIATEFHVTVRTAETHRERIMRKLDIHNVAGLTRFAIASGIVEL